jgi:hypothetical protein
MDICFLAVCVPVGLRACFVCMGLQQLACVYAAGVQESQGGPGKGPVLLVKGLTEGQVATAEEALALIQQGQENRKVGAHVS